MRLINIPLLRKNVLNNMVKPVSAMGAPEILTFSADSAFQIQELRSNAIYGV